MVELGTQFRLSTSQVLLQVRRERLESEFRRETRLQAYARVNVMLQNLLNREARLHHIHQR